MRSEFHEADNRSYQARFADSLMDSLGLESAIHACNENGWDGVLAVLLGRRKLAS